MSEELQRAKDKVERQTQDANRRATMAQRIAKWYRDQAEQNGFREMIDGITRGTN